MAPRTARRRWPADPRRHDASPPRRRRRRPASATETTSTSTISPRRFSAVSARALRARGPAQHLLVTPWSARAPAAIGRSPTPPRDRRAHASIRCGASNATTVSRRSRQRPSQRRRAPRLGRQESHEGECVGGKAAHLERRDHRARPGHALDRHARVDGRAHQTDSPGSAIPGEIRRRSPAPAIRHAAAARPDPGSRARSLCSNRLTTGVESPEMVEQPARAASVLGRDHLHLAQDAQRAADDDVLEVADRRGHQIEVPPLAGPGRGATRSSSALDVAETAHGSRGKLSRAWDRRPPILPDVRSESRRRSRRSALRPRSGSRPPLRDPGVVDVEVSDGAESPRTERQHAARRGASSAGRSPITLEAQVLEVRA